MNINKPINLQGGKYISIGNNTGIGSYTILTAWDNYMNDKFSPEISIGNNVWIGEGCHITAINKIHIGDNVLMGKYITITDNSHGETNFEQLNIHPLSRPLISRGPVRIEDDVWIGDKVTILSNVKIGKGSVIGANSVVTKDIPPFSIAVGMPAKIIK